MGGEWTGRPREGATGRRKVEGRGGNLNDLQLSVGYYQIIFSNLSTSGRGVDKEGQDKKESKTKPASLMERCSDGEQDEQRPDQCRKVSFCHRGTAGNRI